MITNQATPAGLLSEEHEMLRQAAREFAQNEIIPIAAEHDDSGEFPLETIRKMGQLGFMGIEVPEEYGGAGMDTLAYVLALEEICKADAAHGTVMSVNNSLFCYGILKFGTEEQKQIYVRAIATRLAEDAKALQAAGIGVVGIMPNDTVISPGDSFDKMKDFARQHGFTFPYVIDRSQDVARAYGARCTPDFFGFNAALELQYRGRFDASGREPAPKGMRAELLNAMTAVAATGKGPKAQTPSVGCSVKWRN